MRDRNYLLRWKAYSRRTEISQEFSKCYNLVAERSAVTAQP